MELFILNFAEVLTLHLVATYKLGNMCWNLPCLENRNAWRILQQLTNDLETARAEGLFKEERLLRLRSKQISLWLMEATSLILCQQLSRAGESSGSDCGSKAGMDSHGFGMASVRFICGTQTAIKSLNKNWRHSWGWKMRSLLFLL